MPQPLSLQQLNQRFAIPGKILFEAGTGNLPRAAITSPYSQSHIYLHGAHVSHFQVTGQPPLLFLSEKSFYDSNHPIRGGIPICLPWFSKKPDNPDAPMHGTARVQSWTVESTKAADDGNVHVTFSWAGDAETYKWFPHQFVATYVVSVGRELRLSLQFSNTGKSPFEFTEALHTYFQVSDVRQVAIDGLASTDYLDKTRNFEKFNQGAAPIIFTGETDRVYLNTTATCVAHDPAGKRDIIVAKENSLSTVIWNPWTEKAGAMADFSPADWQKMVCIETCNVADSAVKLSPGQSHTMTAIISSRSRT